MRIGAVGVIRAIAIGSLILLATRPGMAVDFSLQVYANTPGGTPALIADVDGSQLGCEDDPTNSDPNVQRCRRQDLPYGTDYVAAEVDIGDPLATSESDPNYYLYIDSDPLVTGTIGITNAQGFTQQYSFVFTLLVASMPSTQTGGRVSGTLTDQGGGGATVSTYGGNPFYYALLDGNNHQQLYPDNPTQFSVVNGSTPIPLQSFGLPGLTVPGGPVNTSIGIRLAFELTGNDAVSFNSNHQVVPEPGTAALLGLGLVWLARRRRSS